MKVYKKNNESISSKLLDEQVILDIEKGKYFSLNPVATKIWDILEQPLTIDTLCDKLIEEYNIEVEKCRTETTAYIQEMMKLGLINEVE
jgi:hypothetical protein